MCFGRGSGARPSRRMAFGPTFGANPDGIPHGALILRKRANLLNCRQDGKDADGVGLGARGGSCEKASQQGERARSHKPGTHSGGILTRPSWNVQPPLERCQARSPSVIFTLIHGFGCPALIETRQPGLRRETSDPLARPEHLLALAVAASRRLRSAARLGSLHSLPLRRVAPFRSRLALAVAASRRLRSAARLGSLHSLPLRRVAPFRSRLALAVAASRRLRSAARLGSLHSLPLRRVAPFRSRLALAV